MTCSQTEKVSLLIDGELPPAEALKVKQHVSQCGECHEARESFLLLRGQLNSYESAIDNAAVQAALAQVLADRSEVRPVTAPGWSERLSEMFSFGRGFSPRFAAAAALVVLAVTIGFVALLMRRQPEHIAVNSQTPNPVAINNSSNTNRNNANPQSQKGPHSQPTAPNSKDVVKPKPTQTPARNAPRPARKRTETAPNYSAIEDNVAVNAKPLGEVEVELMTARHLEQSELLLRAFRNLRSTRPGQAPDIRHEQQRAQKLLYQNMLVRREADAKGDVQVATLLGSLEPILLDIANLRTEPRAEEVVAIKERVERKNLVPLLQINSAAVARAYE
jgi:negative regulator of sigma E activity